MADFLEIERGFEEILRMEPVRYTVKNELSKCSSVQKLQHQASVAKLERMATRPMLFKSASKSSEDDPSNMSLKIDEEVEKKCALNKLLLEAVRYRDVESIEKLLIAGANPNATCSIELISACHVAALRPDGALAMILSHGAEKNRCDILGRTPLHIAAWVGNVRQVAMLLGFPKDLIDRVASSEMTADVAEEVRNVSQFLSHIVDAHCQVSNTIELVPEWADSMIEHNCKELEKSMPLLPLGSTPLHAASLRAKSQCMRLLLAAGADPNSQDLDGKAPLDIVGSAYYADEYVDRASFSDAVSVLIEAHAAFSVKNRQVIDTPLHIAVELNSLDTVKVLTNYVPVCRKNQAGLSPMHICVKKRLREIYQVLIHDKLEIENETKLKSAADVRDSEGHTVLHTAIIEGWEYGVSAAIQAGANVLPRDNNGDTTVLLAAAAGNIEILKMILNATKKSYIIDETNSQGETPLIKAVINGHAECVKQLLKANASHKRTLPYQKNILHIAAEKGHEDVLRVLLDNDSIRDMVNNLSDDKFGFGPIHYAVHNNHPKCLKLLLSKNAFKDLKTSLNGDYIGATALHIAASCNNVNIAQMLMKNDPYTISNVNSLNWTPLHTACSYGHRDMIVLLLKEGADLSAIATDKNGKTKVTGIELLINSLSKPTEFLENLFDTCISTNDLDIQDPNCEITVDYRVLAPTAEGKEQIKVIDALVKTGDTLEQTRLLLHPLLESFLYLKWKALLPFFYTMIVTYGVFVLTLTTYVITVFFQKDKYGNTKELAFEYLLSVMVYITSFFVVVLEALYVTINTKYFLNLETWIKFGAILLALTLPNAISNLKDGLDEYPRHIATLALLLSWLEMLFLVSRFPTWGYYVLMFGKVSLNVIKILVTFSFLVMGFALSFMIQFHHQSDFDTPWAAFIKILVMMTSDLNYNDLLKEKSDYTLLMESDENIILQYVTPVLIFRVMFVAFLILGTIVLMNLMVGVAVNDLHNLEVLGNIKRLSKQVEFLASLDTLLYNRYFRRYIPKSVERVILKRKTILSVITLCPSDSKSKFYKLLPMGLRNSIFEKAQLRKQEMDDKIGSLSYKKKLDEIYEAAVMKNATQKDNYTGANKVDEGSGRRTDNTVRSNMDFDSGIIDVNRQTSEILNEIRAAVMQLEFKMNLMYTEFQNNKSKS